MLCATYDLKRGAVKHKDIGQMNMYLGYFAKEENVEGDNKEDLRKLVRNILVKK